MDITQLDEEIKKIIERNKSFIVITAEQMIKEISEFCADNDILPGSDEYETVTSYAHYWILIHLGTFLTLEKMKKFPKIDGFRDLNDLDDIDID